eukprot:884309-Rhodomonas_salina.1
MLSSLATLCPSLWVDSHVISAWHALVASHAGHVCFSSQLLPTHSTWVMDTTFFDLLTGVNRAQSGLVNSISGFSELLARRSVHKKDTRRVNRVVVPVNLNNNHWIS